MKITKQQLKELIKEELETVLNEKRTPDYYAKLARGEGLPPGYEDEPVLDDEGNLLPHTDPNFEASTIKPGEQDGLFPGHLVGAHGDVYQNPTGVYVTDVAQKDRTDPVTGKSKDDHYGTDLGGFGRVSSAGTRVPDTIRPPIRKQQGLVTHSGYEPGGAGHYTDTEFVKPFGGYGVSSTGEPIVGRAFNLDDYEDGAPTTRVRSMHHADGGDLEAGDYVPVDGKIADAGTSGHSTAKHGHIELGSPGDIDDAIAQGKNISDYMPTKSQWLAGEKEQRFQTSADARDALDRAIARRAELASAERTSMGPGGGTQIDLDTMRDQSGQRIGSKGQSLGRRTDFWPAGGHAQVRREIEKGERHPWDVDPSLTDAEKKNLGYNKAYANYMMSLDPEEPPALASVKTAAQKRAEQYPGRGKGPGGGTQVDLDTMKGPEGQRLGPKGKPLDAPPPAVASYKVKEGDSLSKLARARGITIEDIMAANPNIKNPNKIKLGQKLKIPPPTGKRDDDEGIPKPGQNLAEAWGFNMDLSKLNE